MSNQTELDPPAERAETHRPTLRERLIGVVQVLVVIAFVIAAILFAREDRSRPGGGFARGADAAVAPLVTALIPEPSTSTVEVAATGTVTVRNYVALTPQVTGRIVSIDPALRVGGTFVAGQELLKIDPKDFELALDQAVADIAAANSNLELLQAERDAATANYALLNGNKPVPPLVAKTPQIAQGRAQIAAARARASVAELELSRTSFRLPFSGKVTQSTAEVGQLVTRGQPFGEVFASDAVQVTVPLPQDDVRRLAPVVGRRATVSSDGITVAGTVERVAAQLDDRTRFARLFLNLDDSDRLTPGSFVQVTLSGPVLQNTFVLPTTVQQPGGVLWVVRDNKLERIEPELRFRTRSQIVVDAFESGDGIVIGSVPGAAPGLPVQVAGHE